MGTSMMFDYSDTDSTNTRNSYWNCVIHLYYVLLFNLVVVVVKFQNKNKKLECERKTAKRRIEKEETQIFRIHTFWLFLINIMEETNQFRFAVSTEWYHLNCFRDLLRPVNGKVSMCAVRSTLCGIVENRFSRHKHTYKGDDTPTINNKFNNGNDIYTNAARRIILPRIIGGGAAANWQTLSRCIIGDSAAAAC